MKLSLNSKPRDASVSEQQPQDKSVSEQQPQDESSSEQQQDTSATEQQQDKASDTLTSQSSDDSITLPDYGPAFKTFTTKDPSSIPKKPRYSLHPKTEINLIHFALFLFTDQTET